MRASELLERFEELRRVGTAGRRRRGDAGARLCLTPSRRLWLGVTLIVAASAFLLLSDMEAARGGTSRDAARRDASSSTRCKLLDDGVHGLLDQLKENGYERAATTAVDRTFNAENDMATANSIAKEITSGQVRLRDLGEHQLPAGGGQRQPRGQGEALFGVVADPVVGQSRA